MNFALGLLTLAACGRKLVFTRRTDVRRTNIRDQGTAMTTNLHGKELETGAVPGLRRHDSGQRIGDAGRHPVPDLLAEAVDATGLGECIHRPARPDRQRQDAELPDRLLRHRAKTTVQTKLLIGRTWGNSASIEIHDRRDRLEARHLPGG